MREIKFRGKNLYDVIVRQEDGDDFTEIKAGRMWLYGGYAEIDGKGYLFPEAKCHQANGDYWMDDDAPDIPIVDKETVGQYTGLKDKNGKEIWEGDIIECGRNRYVCEFVEGGFEFRDLSDGGLILKAIVLHAHIIGNIHDNPELFKED